MANFLNLVSAVVLVEIAAAVTAVAVAVVTMTITVLKLNPMSISTEMLVCSVVVLFSPVSCVKYSYLSLSPLATLGL